jgi:linoleoyl-CoA desaturase
MSAQATTAIRPPRFAKEGAFRHDLEARVADYFAKTGLPERDVPAMYLKTAIIMAWFFGNWAVLVFAPIREIAGPLTVPLYLLLAMSQGMSVGAIGMSVMHDANHGAYSKLPWVNRLVGWSLDMLGASSFVWRTKHNAVHHTWTNVDGCDDDIAMEPLSRMTASQQYRPWYAAQHLYMWPLYCMLHVKWVIHDDFKDFRNGKVSVGLLPRRSWTTYLTLFLSKVSYISLAFVIPMLYHDALPTVGLWLLSTSLTGLVLAVTFQLAHCVEIVEFPLPEAPGKPLARDWAEHQLATTADFADGNKLATWLMGGLNYQVVHHLFPKICHLHYPALSKLVAATAAEHGLQYRSYPTVRSAVASHYRYLRMLAQPNPVLASHESDSVGPGVLPGNTLAA